MLMRIINRCWHGDETCVTLVDDTGIYIQKTPNYFIRSFTVSSGMLVAVAYSLSSKLAIKTSVVVVQT